MQKQKQKGNKRNSYSLKTAAFQVSDIHPGPDIIKNFFFADGMLLCAVMSGCVNNCMLIAQKTENTKQLDY